MKESPTSRQLFFKASLFLFTSFFLASCASSHHQPCTWGGQPARATPLSTIGKRSCDQVEDDSGQRINEGKYYEWYLNDRIALVGEYKKGKKSGRWLEYNEQGEVVSEMYFEDGKEVPPPYELKPQRKKSP